MTHLQPVPCPPPWYRPASECFDQVRQFEEMIEHMVDKAVTEKLNKLYQQGALPPGVVDGSDAKVGQVGEFVRLFGPDFAFTGTVVNESQMVNVGVLPAGDWLAMTYAYITAETTGCQFYLTPVPTGVVDSMGAMLALHGPENVTLVGPTVRCNLTVPSLFAFQCSVNNQSAAGNPGVMSVRMNAWRMR